ncbi:MAG: sugar ABC transporter permease, partial [Clostridia bacterium]|nr:sugar ABC transporter permease [Clostridia bacterium]
MTSALKAKRQLSPALREFKGYIKYWDLCLMLLPVIAYFIIFKYIPMGGIVIAFKDFKLGLGVSGSEWVGLANFVDAFRTRFFIRAIRNTLIISVLKLCVGFPAPIILALLLNEVRHSGYKRVIQTISYLPHFLSWIIMAGILSQLLSPNNGAVNGLLKSLGRKDPVPFLLDNTYFRGTVVISDVWKGVGWGSILYLAAISSIDPTLYEAAICDGATRPQRVRYITIPCILPTITIMLILSLGGILDAGFDQLLNLYSSAVYETGDIIDTYVYRVGLV